jgi:diguanylate cyclase (GGDEF)-like protein/PAS domain S-box-containing protein
MSMQDDHPTLPPLPAAIGQAGVSPALRRALHEQQAVFDNPGVGVAIVRRGLIVRCNRRFAQIFGHKSPLELVGQSSQVFLPEPLPVGRNSGAPAEAAWATPTSRQETLLRRGPQQSVWCSLTIQPVTTDATEEAAAWLVEDISARKRLEVELRAAVLDQNLILDNALIGIVFLRERRVTRCNRCFAELLGYEPAELAGKSSRVWYLDEASWVDAGQYAYEPLAAGLPFQGEMRLRRKDGSALWADVRSKAVDPHDLALGSIWIVADITSRKEAEAGLVEVHSQLERLVDERTQELRRVVTELHRKVAEHERAEERIQHMAHYDPLTELPNRTMLARSASEAIASAQASHKPLAVMFLDLDRFKNVNDSLGHRVGDELLAALAVRLKSAVREADTVARLGGDEFMLILPDTDAQGAAHVAQKLIARAEPPFQIGTHELAITPSIGIAMYPVDGEDFDTLSQRADAAMYRAKRDGRNNFCFFTQEMQAHAARTLVLENALRRALEREQLQLYYQPLVELRTGRVTGAEALLRWRHPEFGTVSPVEFIPVAEASGLVGAIGEWVLRTAVKQLKAWFDSGLPRFTLAVNLSAMQLRHVHLPDLISEILESSQMPAEYLELELTEGAAMEDPLRAIAVMDDLHARGIRMSIDDFGTGYSSLSYLKRFHVYKLKIDQSFVRDITDDPEDKAIVSAIIHMASSLGLQTIAEGVETEGQLAFLRQQDCDEAQGYLFSRPLAPAQFEAFMRDLQDHH